MSADNYNYVRQDDNGKWCVWLNLSASCDLEQNIGGQKPDARFDSCEAAVVWADAQGYTEYGTEVAEREICPDCGTEHP